ncbi:uncharacterized protein LOC142644222 [Castanea sativa]|uniref:uncharacterized protein LOC142644222 n=1 Tax=Castanea sativa TaxID=21020 RepID=UPI003F64C72B
MEYLEEYRAIQNQFHANRVQHPSRDSWQPLPSSVYKLNFDAAVFTGLDRTDFGAVIRNDKGEVMATMSAKGPSVYCSEEAKFLACRKAIEFATDAGFSEFIVEGDNSTVMQAISSPNEDESLMGNVVGDIRQMLRGLHLVNVEFTRRGGNKVAHVLAQYAKDLIDDMYWMEDLPPFAREALYHDANIIG